LVGLIENAALEQIRWEGTLDSAWWMCVWA